MPNSVRIVERVRCHGPPAMLRPATPRHSSANVAHIPRTQVIDDAYADPIGPIRSTLMKTYASVTLTPIATTLRNIGVRVSPAARIAEVPMSQSVAAPFAEPT